MDFWQLLSEPAVEATIRRFTKLAYLAPASLCRNAATLRRNWLP